MSELAALSALLNREIEAGRLADGAMYIEHNGVVIHDAVYGSAKPDAIWKIYSMSKPITAVAAAICMERGLFNPMEDAGKYIPALKNPMVVQHDGSLKAASRPVTIQTLLNMSSGLPYPGDGNVSEVFMQQQRELMDERVAAGEKLTTAEVCNQLAMTPLQFEPGTGFRYGVGADIIGGIIEITSGLRYDEFLRKEIFAPLGMTETGFYLTPEQLKRLEPMYSMHPRQSRLELATAEELDWLSLSAPGKEPAFLSGGGGLYSTLSDYVKFARMLLNGGRYTDAAGAEQRLYGRKTDEVLHANSLLPSALAQFQTELRPGYGYNCFMRVLLDPAMAGCNGSVGEFGWDGLPGHYLHIDQRENLFMVYMQHVAQGADMDLRQKMYNMVYATL